MQEIVKLQSVLLQYVCVFPKVTVPCKILYNENYRAWASLVAQMVKRLPVMQETQI